MSVPAAQATPILFTHYGEEWIRGSERCLLDLLTHIDRKRFRPVVWCNAEMLAAEARALDVRVHLSRFSLLLHWTPPRYDFANYRKLVREGRHLVGQHGIRLMHSNSAGPTQWLFPIARRARIPLLTHLHAPYNKRERVTLGIHQATLAVGVTRGCLDGLLEDGLPEGRTTTVYNGVDLSVWKGQDQKELRARLGIGPDEIVLTQAGSLIHRKGHDILLRAFAELRRQRANCWLLIAGEGEDRASIEAVARALDLGSSVHFLGFVPSGPIFRDATDIAVSPSRAEGFGLTVIEAGAFGKVVVATDTTGMDEIITDGVNGIIVPIEDAPRLTEALLRLVDDPALRASMGRALRATVEDRFLISNYVQNLESAYTRLLGIPAKQLGWRGSYWNGEFAMYGRWLATTIGGRLSRLTRRATGGATPIMPAE